MTKCDVCDIEMRLYSLPAHRRTKGHLRAIGELPPKPPKLEPEKKPIGRPKIYASEEQRRARNKEYYKNKTYYCEICDLNVTATNSTTHKGTRAHMARLLASIYKAEADPATCVECLD